eukprot:TRINITY_DN22508_c0_g1_i1.p1 TRINITY_DN22508_c0_g1~~TRINITY_DN22508_c0_g1_i1.p1  ORF type:complete len:257 (-),score=52.49 TRINITY_DN22508_c0_g1_i1:109-879(-)
MSRRLLSKALPILALLLIGAAFYGLMWRINVKKYVEDIVFYIEAQGDSAMHVYLVATFFGVVLLFPTTPMEFAGGFLFSNAYGMWLTWLLTCVAKLLANIVSVMLARYVVRDWVRRNIISKYEILGMVESAVKDEPFKMAFLVRGSMVPLSVKNYGLAVMDIGYIPIACCSCIFTPFYAFQNIMLGQAAGSLKEVFSPKRPSVDQGSWTSYVKSLFPIVFNLLLVYSMVKAIQAQLRKRKNCIEQDLRSKQAKKAS